MVTQCRYFKVSQDGVAPHYERNNPERPRVDALLIAPLSGDYSGIETRTSRARRYGVRCEYGMKSALGFVLGWRWIHLSALPTPSCVECFSRNAVRSTAYSFGLIAPPSG